MQKKYFTLGYLIIYVVLGIVLIAGLGTLILKKPFFLVPIRSNSMYPLLERGDAVLIQTANPNAISVGDVVVFRATGGSLAAQGWVMHRIAGGNKEEGFITKGDANEYTDQEHGDAQLVKCDSIAAKAVSLGGRPLRIRLLGYPSLWMEQYNNSPYALPGCLGAVALLLIITELKNKRRAKRNKDVPAYIIYPAAGMAICILLGATQIAASSFLTLQYEVSPAGRGVIMGSAVGILQQGDQYTRELATVRGKGFLPMVASITSDDNQFIFNKELVVTKPGAEERLSVTVKAGEVGQYKSRVYVGMFLPTLPPVLIHKLAGINFWLALGVVSLIPALPFILWPVIDSRLRRLMSRALRRRLFRVTQKIIP